MTLTNRIAGIALAMIVTGVSAASAQPALAEVLARYGVRAKPGAFDQAFDALAAPTIPVTPGAFATPLAVLTTTVGDSQVDAAYAFGILAGRSGRAASPPELMAAGQALTAMIGAIVLTLHHKPGVKRQDIGAQVARNPETAVEVRKVPSRAGI